MGHDEDKNDFDGMTAGQEQTTQNSLSRLTANSRIGMRPSRNFSAQDELNRISGTDGSAITINNNQQKKKSNKKVIILAILVVAIIVVFGVGFLLRGTGIIGGKGGAVRKRFNEYANFLLYGKESGDDITEDKYSTGSRYHLTEIIDASKYDKEERNRNIDQYFDTAYKKYIAFEEAYRASGRNDLDEYIKNYGKDLDIYHYIVTTPLLVEEELRYEYATNANVSDMVSSYYAPYENSSVQTTKDFVKKIKNNDYSYLNIVKQYDSVGCFNKESRKINRICTNNNNEPYKAINDDYSMTEKSRVDNYDYISELPRKIYFMIWKVKGYIYENK